MHARPRFFAKVMGELLFWVGEDKMLWASDYAIWEPRWQVEGFVDWTSPDDVEFSDYPRLTTDGKKKILGLNAAKLYGIDVPVEFQIPAEAGEPAASSGRHTRSVPASTALRRKLARSWPSSSTASPSKTCVNPARAATPPLIWSEAKRSSSVTTVRITPSTADTAS